MIRSWSGVRLEFYDRRSATFTSDIVVQWSVDGDTTFGAASDTIRIAGCNDFVSHSFVHAFHGEPQVIRIRWLIVGNGASTVGTYRIDDITLCPADFADLRLLWLVVDPPLPRLDQKIRLKACVRNYGTADAGGIPVVLIRDRDDDSLASIDELTDTKQIDPIGPSDSCIVEFDLGRLPPVRHRYAVLFSEPSAGNEVNGVVWCEFAVRPIIHSIVINELMFAPLAGLAEYIELFNTSDDDIDIGNWKVEDAAAFSSVNTRGVRLPARAFIKSKGYYLIASDSSLFRFFPIDRNALYIEGRSSLGLNNDKDDVRLRDPALTSIDSVSYSAAWHHPDRKNTDGISLERIDPLGGSSDRHNWTSSTDEDGGTPGRANSVFTAAAPSSALVSISPNPFSPDGDSVDDVVTISVRFPATAATVRMRIFDIAGRCVRTLLAGYPSGPACTVSWDGFDDNRHRCRIGIYILYLEALDGRSGMRICQKSLITLAARLR